MPAGGTYLCEEVARVWRVCGVCVASRTWGHLHGLLRLCVQRADRLAPASPERVCSFGRVLMAGYEQTQYEQLRCRLTADNASSGSRSERLRRLSGVLILEQPRPKDLRK